MDICIRVYNNGEEVCEKRSGERTQDWLKYNSAFRFGCALFVNAVCKYRGYLSEERCKELEIKFSKQVFPLEPLA